MRILQLGKSFPVTDGVEKLMVSLVEGLSARGIDCDMLCTAHPGLPGRIREPIGGGRIIAVRPSEMAIYLKEHAAQYDLIHIHHPDALAARALRRSGYRGPVILHWHADYRKRGVTTLLHRFVQRWLIRRADCIVGTSPVYVKESPRLRRVQDKCTYVPIGTAPVDTTGEEAIRNRYPGKKIILSVGRLERYKGLPHLLEAAALLPDDYRIIIGGTGPLRASLERQIRERNLSDKVSLEGFIKDGGLGAYYGAADVFVMSSTTKAEAFGIVQIEAFSCGTPVVSTRIPGSGVSWVNEDGVSGLTVPPGDAKALADAIRTVAEHPEKYGEKARGRYSDLFTKEKMLDGILAVYRRFLAI